jgi:hypothetical protein
VTHANVYVSVWVRFRVRVRSVLVWFQGGEHSVEKISENLIGRLKKFLKA